MMRRTTLSALLAAALLAGCGSLPDKPVREVMYDLGPLSTTPAATAAADSATPLVLNNVNAGAALETPALLYRLGYADVHQLRPYAYARWSAPPGELLEQRLREYLGRSRPVLSSAAGAALARRSGSLPPVLRVELEEFSHLFDAPGSSRGTLRVRCTLMESTTAGDRLVAQRSFAVERPAPTADAAGGVRALAAASDAVAQEIAAWLAQQR